MDGRNIERRREKETGEIDGKTKERKKKTKTGSKTDGEREREREADRQRERERERWDQRGAIFGRFNHYNNYYIFDDTGLSPSAT